jgi:foldase protein PrsA
LSNSNKGTATVTILAVLVTLAVAGGGGYMLGGRLSQPEVQAVATVNGDKITKTALYDRMIKENGATTVDQMITELLVEQEAKKTNNTVTPAEVDAEIAKVKASVGGEDAFAQALASNNMTLDQLKDRVKFQVKVQKILSKDIKTDDATLQEYFKAHASDFDKQEIHARHILVATEDEAKAIKAQLDKGADFAALAKEKSTEPAAKTSGGDLGFFGHGKMDPDFEKAAFALKVKEISQPVKSQFGWHVIQLLETKGQAPTFENSKAAVKDAVTSQGLNDKYQEWMTGLKDKAKIDNTLAPKK